MFLIVAGKAFQSLGAAHINERSPRVAKDFVLGYRSCVLLLDLSLYLGFISLDCNEVPNILR